MINQNNLKRAETAAQRMIREIYEVNKKKQQEQQQEDDMISKENEGPRTIIKIDGQVFNQENCKINEMLQIYVPTYDPQNPSITLSQRKWELALKEIITESENSTHFIKLMIPQICEKNTIFSLHFSPDLESITSFSWRYQIRSVRLYFPTKLPNGIKKSRYREHYSSIFRWLESFPRLERIMIYSQSPIICNDYLSFFFHFLLPKRFTVLNTRDFFNASKNKQKLIKVNCGKITMQEFHYIITDSDLSLHLKINDLKNIIRGFISI
jgi:hypothetical protein